MNDPDYYKILGIPSSAGDQELRAAYRRLARECHPDALHNLSSAEQVSAAEKMQLLISAWATLSNSQRRLEYDRKFGLESSCARRRILIRSVHAAASRNDVEETYRVAHELLLHFPEDDKGCNVYAESSCALGRKLLIQGGYASAEFRFRRAMDVARDDDIKLRAKSDLKLLKCRLREHAREARKNHFLRKVREILSMITGGRLKLP